MPVSLDPQTRNVLIQLGFIEDPFFDQSDTRFLCFTGQYLTTIETVLKDIQEHNGITFIAGEAGTGKSLLAKRIYQVLKPDSNYKTALFTDPEFSTLGSLYLSLAYMFDLHRHKETVRRIEAFEEFMDLTRDQGESIVLIVDQAEKMTNDEFHQLIKLFRPRTIADRFVQFVFFSRPSLSSEIPKIEYRPGTYYHPIRIRSLSFAEAKEMIHFRCQVAGRSPIFSEQALERVYSISKGNPRNIIRFGQSVLRVVASRKKQFADLDDIDITLSIFGNSINALIPA